MDKSNTGAPTPCPRLLINELGSGLLEMLQGSIDIGNCQRYVVHSLAPRLDESTDRSVGTQRLEQLDERPAHSNHRFLDPLGSDHFSIDRFGTVHEGIVGQGSVEIANGDGYVVQVVGEHGHKGSSAAVDLAKVAMTSELPRET